MKILVLTSDRTAWALRPMAWLFNKYWTGNVPVTVGGYTHPEFDLPTNFAFHSIGNFEDYPVQRWSNGLIEFLNDQIDSVIALFLDDYWLHRDVDVRGVSKMAEYMEDNPSVARFDLTTDRLYARGVTDYAKVGHLDVIKSDPASPYHFSYQASLWRREALLKCLVPDETPWKSEMSGDGRLNRLDGSLVLGTRQAPVRYTIAIQKGKFTPDGGYQLPINAMNDEDLHYILDQGWVPTCPAQ